MSETTRYWMPPSTAERIPAPPGRAVCSRGSDGSIVDSCAQRHRSWSADSGHSEYRAAGPKPRRSPVSFNSASLRSGRTNEGSSSSSSRGWHAVLWEDRSRRCQRPAHGDAAGIWARAELSLRNAASARRGGHSRLRQRAPFRAARRSGESSRFQKSLGRSAAQDMRLSPPRFHSSPIGGFRGV